jgi:sulfur-oxidizing protein SoxY
MVLTRRALLVAGAAGGAGLAGLVPVLSADAGANDEAAELIKKLTGRTPTTSDRLRVIIPPVFPNGYTVPLVLEVDSPMTEADYVKSVRVFAPKNPIVEIAGFRFSPQCGIARVSTRVRIAAPQFVLAAAEMSDGSCLMAKTWVKVETNGCI